MSGSDNQDSVLTGGNFIRNIIDDDIKSGKYQGKVQTRFPPEPNGYLHIGHAKAICINFGIANHYPDGACNLRFDDTNPAKEDIEYTEAIERDVRWLGFDWGANQFHASNYYEQLYQFACALIDKGLAYVCELTPDEIREKRGTLTQKGEDSPYRNRSILENRDLFSKMKNGEFEDGSRVLRAKIDMSSGNINLRDPIVYRIRKISHHRTGDDWCIYPMYDFAHCMSDYLEGITHSLCTLEFQDHRPLYDWFIKNLVEEPHPHQYEFSRLNLNFTMTSKRKLKALVDEKIVNGWDDPRMPTICGFRRRGYTPGSIRNFCDRLGVSKKETVIDMSVLEDALREDLNEKANRVMCVLDPLKVTVTSYPENQIEMISVKNHPMKEERGRREIPFTREIFIEREDFTETPVKNFHRLSPGAEVRLRYGFVVRCDEVIKDPSGNVIELKCTHDPDTLGGKKPVGRKVKGIIHWVSASESVNLEVRIYDRLFNVPFPGAEEKNGKDFRDNINQESLVTLKNCVGEFALKELPPGQSYQFERQGYFTPDPDSKPDRLVFNRAVTLRDTWAKETKN